jgi:prepilin-type N-terminal cleavage/methylation domain-containing protein
MRGAPRQNGFTLIEVLIAVVLLSTCGLALARTLVSAQQAQRTSEHWMTAVQLAAEGVEQLRQGRGIDPAPVGTGFERSGQEVSAGPEQLCRLEVTVSWMDREPRRFRLATLVRR